MGVLEGCIPREEVLKGDLDDAIFAADFGDVVADRAPKVYGDPRIFFQNTHPAAQLCKVIQAVFGRLSDPMEAGATIRLSTGFGGGKTHTLIALWHLARNISDPGMGIELLPAAGRPKKVKVVGIDASKAGEVFARHGDLVTRSLWGELSFQLGGPKALDILGRLDHPERQPDEALVESLFPPGPVLILLDEVVIYMATLTEQGQGNLLAFLNKLAGVVAKRPQTVLVVTDPADQRAFASQAARVGDSITAAAIKLDDLFGRRMTDFDPIGEESAQVIVRRLFEKVDPAAAQKASALYHSLYERVTRESPGLLPIYAASADYAKKMVQCYPFHPRLVETAQGRLGALQEFNKSRGTLRLFARILRSIWETGQELELITAGDVDWSSDRIQADLLQRLNRDNFKAAVSADIQKHAVELDEGERRGIHVRVASALLLESVPMQANSGLEPADLTLAVLRPEEAGPEPSEALDRLVGVCWHTYPLPGGRGWQFRYEPNVIKQVEERMGHIPIDDAKSKVLSEVQGYFSGPAFKLAAWPTSARQVPESAELQLALCEDEKTARSVCAYSDDSDPSALMPRLFRNAILAVTATASSLNTAVERARRLLAAEAIEREQRTGEASKLVREQLQRIKPELQKQFRLQSCRAFDRVVLPGGASYQMEEKYQVPEDKIMQKAQGQALLRSFLDDKDLVYKQGESLDTGRFMKEILRGATPLAEDPEVFTAKAVHERFLAAPGLRLVPNGDIVRQTILKALAAGKIAIRLANGKAYDASGCVDGPPGNRRRLPGSLSTLSLDDKVWLARVESQAAFSWLREETQVKKEEQKGKGFFPPSPTLPPKVTATTWERVLEYARTRPLLELKLTAGTPAEAAVLSGLAQPLGAEKIALSVTVGGNLKGGGRVNFQANDLKPTHPIGPLVMSQTLFNAMEEGADYEAELALSFGASGRQGLESMLSGLAEQAPEGVKPQAVFGEPSGGTQ
ncbi:MAG: ATP-binding protein [Rhodocyclaceae bacterium]|nr:ATP-binding protein [Rhodocyclaceae bacterium]